MKSKHLWKISMTVSLPIALAVGDVRGYCVLSNHCHIQILDVSHDLLNGFVSGLPFSSPPPPSPISNLLSPSPLGRPDTQAISFKAGLQGKSQLGIHCVLYLILQGHLSCMPETLWGPWRFVNIMTSYNRRKFHFINKYRISNQGMVRTSHFSQKRNKRRPVPNKGSVSNKRPPLRYQK